MSNIYYDPEDFGLTVVKHHDIAGAYEFDTVIVLRRDVDGQLFAAHDSGCSCPLPFDNVKVPDLTPIATRADLDAFAREVWADSYRFDTPAGLDAAVVQLVSFDWSGGAA